MKKVLPVAFLFLLFSAFGIHSSYAECGCMGKMSGGMEESDMPMMGGMMHQGMMGADHPMWKHLMGIGLDEKQQEAIKEIKGRLMKDTIKKRADEHIAGIEMKELLDKDPVDMKAVEAKLKQREAIETDIHLSHIKAMEEVKAKLTPDQRKKMKEMMEMGPMMGGMGMMQGGCGMMGGMMQHGGMGATPPAGKQEEKQPPTEHKH